jgi:S1-C subfamily serine protease
MRPILLVACIAGCAAAPHGGADPCPEVRAHCYEVPRVPHPAYVPDGVQITRLDGDSAWARAGLLVNDVIESVNGAWTTDVAAFRKAVGAHPPRRVRVLESRAGPVGQYRVVAIEIA